MKIGKINRLAKAGELVSVRLPNGQTISAKAGNDLRSTTVLVSKTQSGWFAFSSQGETKTTSTQVTNRRPREVIPDIYPFKSLIVFDSNSVFKSGDGSIVELLPDFANPRTIGITNLGKKKFVAAITDDGNGLGYLKILDTEYSFDGLRSVDPNGNYEYYGDYFIGVDWSGAYKLNLDGLTLGYTQSNQHRVTDHSIWSIVPYNSIGDPPLPEGGLLDTMGPIVAPLVSWLVARGLGLIIGGSLTGLNYSVLTNTTIPLNSVNYGLGANPPDERIIWDLAYLDPLQTLSGAFSTLSYSNYLPGDGNYEGVLDYGIRYNPVIGSAKTYSDSQGNEILTTSITIDKRAGIYINWISPERSVDDTAHASDRMEYASRIGFLAQEKSPEGYNPYSIYQNDYNTGTISTNEISSYTIGDTRYRDIFDSVGGFVVFSKQSQLNETSDNGFLLQESDWIYHPETAAEYNRSQRSDGNWGREIAIEQFLSETNTYNGIDRRQRIISEQRGLLADGSEIKALTIRDIETIVYLDYYRVLLKQENDDGIFLKISQDNHFRQIGYIESTFANITSRSELLAIAANEIILNDHDYWGFSTEDSAESLPSQEQMDEVCSSFREIKFFHDIETSRNEDLFDIGRSSEQTEHGRLLATNVPSPDWTWTTLEETGSKPRREDIFIWTRGGTDITLPSLGSYYAITKNSQSVTVDEDLIGSNITVSLSLKNYHNYNETTLEYLSIIGSQLTFVIAISNVPIANDTKFYWLICTAMSTTNSSITLRVESYSTQPVFCGIDAMIKNSTSTSKAGILFSESNPIALIGSALRNGRSNIDGDSIYISQPITSQQVTAGKKKHYVEQFLFDNETLLFSRKSPKFGSLSKTARTSPTGYEHISYNPK